MACPGFIFNRFGHLPLVLKTALPLFSNAQNGISHALISPKHADFSGLARGSEATSTAGWLAEDTASRVHLAKAVWLLYFVPK